MQKIGSRRGVGLLATACASPSRKRVPLTPIRRNRVDLTICILCAIDGQKNQTFVKKERKLVLLRAPAEILADLSILGQRWKEKIRHYHVIAGVWNKSWKRCGNWSPIHTWLVAACVASKLLHSSLESFTLSAFWASPRFNSLQFMWYAWKCRGFSCHSNRILCTTLVYCLFSSSLTPAALHSHCFWSQVFLTFCTTLRLFFFCLKNSLWPIPTLFLAFKQLFVVFGNAS